jgi:hypothetical protein
MLNDLCVGRVISIDEITDRVNEMMKIAFTGILTCSRASRLGSKILLVKRHAIYCAARG